VYAGLTKWGLFFIWPFD